jgi:hypothetical protein
MIKKRTRPTTTVREQSLEVEEKSQREHQQADKEENLLYVSPVLCHEFLVVTSELQLGGPH